MNIIQKDKWCFLCFIHITVSFMGNDGHALFLFYIQFHTLKYGQFFNLFFIFTDIDVNKRERYFTFFSRIKLVMR